MLNVRNARARSNTRLLLLCLALVAGCAAKESSPGSATDSQARDGVPGAAGSADGSAAASGSARQSTGSAASSSGGSDARVASGADIAAANGGAAAAGGTGGADHAAANGGAAAAAGGNDVAGSDARNDAAPGAASDAASGGAGGSGGAGADAATGGAAASAASGGAPASGVGGAGGPGSAGPAAGEGTLDSDGCPLTLEGFATLSEEGQREGTSGGSAGETVTVTSQAELSMYAESDAPYVIRVQGALKLSPKGTEIHVASNKTIIGQGAQAEIVEGGFFLGEGVHNVIIRNLTISGTFVEGDWEGKTQDYDGVQMDTAHHVWIDHCHFHHIGDGIIDSRKDTTFLTVSWNILSDHNKAFGIGWTDNVTSQITVHHNWLRDTNQRNPSTDNVLRAHLYNNWLQRISSYGNYARGGTNMVLENSVFDSVKDPHFYDTGSLVAIGNLYTDSSGKRDATGSTYDFFDPHDFYAYTLTPAADVAPLLQRCAGPRPTLR